MTDAAPSSTDLVADGFEPVREALLGFAEADPTYSAQLAVHHHGAPVVDLTVGPGLDADSLLPVFSSGKGTIGITVGVLVQRGVLDLDERVATYWPEFAAAGKSAVTVRQLLSHQAGLFGVDGGYPGDELLAHTPLAERLAAQRPFWQPGRAFGYHGITIGTLADELVRRTDGRTLSQLFADEVAGPRGIDVHVGVPEALDGRVRDVTLPTAEELGEWADRMPWPAGDSISTLTGPRTDTPIFLWVNGVACRRVGPPAAGVVASARGLASMYASLHHTIGGEGRLLDDDTIAQLAQSQSAGTDVLTDMAAHFGIVFQRPHKPRLAFGSGLAFGHDGAGGAIGFSDPHHDVAFGYLTQRIPLPGGVDARAITLTEVVRRCVSGR